MNDLASITAGLSDKQRLIAIEEWFGMDGSYCRHLVSDCNCDECRLRRLVREVKKREETRG